MLETRRTMLATMGGSVSDGERSSSADMIMSSIYTRVIPAFGSIIGLDTSRPFIVRSSQVHLRLCCSLHLPVAPILTYASSSSKIAFKLHSSAALVPLLKLTGILVKLHLITFSFFLKASYLSSCLPSLRLLGHACFVMCCSSL